MASCPTFPTGKVREIIKRTVDTGNEHAFVRCGDGDTTEIVKGGKTSLDISGAIDACNMSDGPVDVIHTHPNGVDRLSDQDRQVAAEDDIRAVCVAVEGGDVQCEMIDSCAPEVANE